jgi:hypothetical protein
LQAGIHESNGLAALETIKTFKESPHVELTGFRADKIQSVGQQFVSTWIETTIEAAEARHDWHENCLQLAKTDQHNGDILLS